ncbi:RnfABCDGE type electron transport complex subunit G [Sulfurisoma sediminicola]|uniref:Ion-translocating oxidoreductase complex subunit G n=1 Tax=Sulfurisoma sediminicola TaxID=1381557 RepID=A0A497X825_9PROT|nr:RnfABCDGE type electron transport complex subunit G [Sulfurisoma sediminicola]RLJ61429.1 electron transport complex protein RnfG [Sulfurisoma sediminicola]
MSETESPSAEKVASAMMAPLSESSVARISVRTAVILLVFTMAFTALMAGVYQLTQPILEKSALDAKRRTITEVLPPDTYDNDLLADAATLPPVKALGRDAPTTIYRARKDGKPVALVFEAAALDGYSGRIDLILAVSADGRMVAQRVTLHKETPGLGDYIDPKKDKNKQQPWIKQFDNLGFDTVLGGKWRVKKDGGIIDQRAGATISARAVTNASGRAVLWIHDHSARLFDLPNGSQWKETSP